MKQALITTTIHRPDVLRRYRELGPDVPFIVAGDKKSPHAEIERLADEIGNCRYLSPLEQAEAYPKLSEAIGWNKVMRRNIATLEAAKLEPDVIVSIDDDNEPRSDTYFTDIERVFSRPHTGNVAQGDWFNLGALAHSPNRYRGFPYGADAVANFGPNGRPHDVGVLNGLIFGDPDINATERLERNPRVGSYEQAALKGIAVDPRQTWTPINSQNTAWRAELAPLMMVLPDVGRYDDIWGSYIAQQVMSATDYCVLFGRPEVQQERHAHDLFKDLEDEVFGMRYTERFVEFLRVVDVRQGASVLDNLGAVVEACDSHGFQWDFLHEWLAVWEQVPAEPISIAHHPV